MGQRSQNRSHGSLTPTGKRVAIGLAHRNKTGFVRKKKSNARKLRQHHSPFCSGTGVKKIK